MVYISKSERADKFRAAFIKKISQFATEQSWTLPTHCFSGEISAKDIQNVVASDKKREDLIGLPIVYFPSKLSSPILISSGGVFFKPHDESRGYLTWDELDFISGGNIITDENTVKIGRSAELMKESVPAWLGTIMLWIAFFVWVIDLIHHSPPFDTSGFWAFLGSIFSVALYNAMAGLVMILGAIFMIPLAAIVTRIVRYVAKLSFENIFKEHYNVLYLGPRQQINIGFRAKASDIGEAIILGLLMYRKQQEKYGRE